MVFNVFQWFLKAGTPKSLKNNGFFGFLCHGIGKTLKTNGFFGFNGFSGFSNFAAIDELTALQPASQDAHKSCLDLLGYFLKL